jgi:hypothetical protein
MPIGPGLLRREKKAVKLDVQAKRRAVNPAIFGVPDRT